MRTAQHAAVQRMEVVGRTLQCVHCNTFLPEQAVVETTSVKVTRSIFKWSAYAISKKHSEGDGINEGIWHLILTVEIARKLNLHQSVTHVKMNIGPTKPKRGNRYEGFEHFHAFILFDTGNHKLESCFQFTVTSETRWANAPMSTDLWGDVTEIKFDDDVYKTLVGRLQGAGGAYFVVVFENGAPKTVRFSSA